MEKGKAPRRRSSSSRSSRRNEGRTSMPPRLNESVWAEGELRLRPGSFAPDKGLLVSEVPKD